MPAELIEVSTEIDATPAEVWAVVSDLTRMGEWSPQCRYTRVRGGGVVEPGARTININRQGFLVWPTTSKVLDVDPERRIAFRVSENGTVWSYDLTALPDGRTRLTERRAAPDGTSAVSRFLVRWVLGGEEGFESGLRAGMEQTLSRIKAAVER